jgi:hypothetical protein
MAEKVVRSEEYWGNAELIARFAADRAEELFGIPKGFLENYVAKKIIQRAADRARDSYLKRLEGTQNDEVSTSPGIILFVTPEGAKSVIEDTSKSEWPIRESAVKPVNPNMSKIYLPYGGYVMDSAVPCQFFQELAVTWGQNNGGRIGGASKPFLLNPELVIRVEGDITKPKYDLWQNPNFKPNGAPKLAIK